MAGDGPDRLLMAVPVKKPVVAEGVVTYSDSWENAAGRQGRGGTSTAQGRGM